MKRTIRDHDKDPAIVRTLDRFIILRLTSTRFDKPTCAHAYRPWQARKLAKALNEAADEMDRKKKKR